MTSSPYGEHEPVVADRRCWRCLQMFPGDPTLMASGPPVWWLCEPCNRQLLGKEPVAT